MERRYIISAFVDIRGFGTWIYRASIPRETKEPFIHEYLGITQDFIRANKDIHFKYLGDGFLAIREFSQAERSNGAVCDFIKGLRAATRKIVKMMATYSQPPDGIRVRITEGYAFKIMVLDPYDTKRERVIPEFIEYGINTAERLMEVNPEIVCLATEGVSKALGKYRSVFGVQPLGTPSAYPKSVNHEDLQTLVVLKF